MLYDTARNRMLVIVASLLVIVAFLFSAGCTVKKAETKKKKPTGPVKMLDPNKIPKYQDALVIPPVMPPTKVTKDYTEYQISARQFKQQVLPKSLPMTTVWGYGQAGDPLPGSGKVTTFNYPAFTVDTRKGAKIRVKWINGLVDAKGNYLPPITAVDQTIHWAAPNAPMAGADPAMVTADPYKGPVPIVTHVHGAHTSSASDGLPNAWYLPDAKNIPDGYTAHGANYATAAPAGNGAAWFEYPNDQRATTLWYHDHALGITRNNVYSGLAGFWIIRDDEEDALKLPGPAPKLKDPANKKYREIPVVIQDRSFNTDGSLFYPASREFFEDYKGAYKPATEVPPIWNPEFFGNSIVVNGKTWPYLNVEPRLYRLRLLNGSDSRFLILKFSKTGLKFQQIGTEGGLLPGAPVVLDQLLMGPAERADVLVDFSSLKKGDEVILQNIGPDEPYKGPDEKLEPADPETTGQVMKFKVTGKTKGAEAKVPAALPAIDRLTTDLPSRELTINEIAATEQDVPVTSLLGTGDKGPLTFDAAVTETPFVGDTEIWEVVNLTADAHPIHLHQVMFQVVERQPINKEEYDSAMEATVQEGAAKRPLSDFITGPAVGPQLWETGLKDTVIANPGQVTRIIAKFDLPGLYVWHCHILEHEDNEMMRPYVVQTR